MQIFVVSGGTGATGELLARTVIAQFHQRDIPIVVKGHISAQSDLAAVVAQAAAAGGIVIHTMVEGEARRQLTELAHHYCVPAFDLAGPLMTYLAEHLCQEPLGQPGRYRHLNEDYFRRIEAIEFAVAHDDGKRLAEVHLADAVLLGVSRVGKTPLSMYLAMLGWKVANVPLVPGVAFPEAIHALEQRRVFGLTINPAQLAGHRRARQRALGIDAGAYFDHQQLIEEVRAANHLFAQYNFNVIDVTDKPIESTSEEIIAILAGGIAQIG